MSKYGILIAVKDAVMYQYDTNIYEIEDNVSAKLKLDLGTHWRKYLEQLQYLLDDDMLDCILPFNEYENEGLMEQFNSEYELAYIEPLNVESGYKNLSELEFEKFKKKFDEMKKLFELAANLNYGIFFAILEKE